MTDLSTTYLGLNLSNPLVAASSTLSKKLDSAKKLEDAGVGAIVMYSLFEEQIEHDQKFLDFTLNQGTESFAEALTYFPDLKEYNVGPEDYLELLASIKKSVNVPVIASLNGISSGGWTSYAKKMEQAGADALELNIYYLPTETETTSAEIEDSYVDLVADVKKEINIPLALKLSPYFTALPSFANRLVKAGADGLVLFNRFYQPDLDVETLEVKPNLVLSNSNELRLPLRWVAILYGRVQADLALTTGVHSATDMVKATMAGANVSMVASELLLKGPERATSLLAEFKSWMETYEYQSVQQMIGSMSQKNVADPAAFERANYMKTLNSYNPYYR